MCCPSDAVLCDLNTHDRRAVAPPEILSSDDEEVDDDLPSEILVYPPTDDEGEPQVKAACELWPVPAPKPKRKHASARTAVVMLGQASALPGTGSCARTILATCPCGAKQQAVGQAAPPEVLTRPPGIFNFPVAKQTVAAPTTATRTPPPGIHRVQAAKETLAASATATGVAVARATVTAAPTAQEIHAHAAHEWKARANKPRITTLVVRNLHISTSQQEFLDEVNRSGFAEKYDFAYIPRGFEDGSGKGLAFINFRTAEAASAFMGGWHRSRRLSTKDEAGQVVPLNVSNATLQGLEANLRKWTSARMTRVKNPDFLPFVLRGAEP
jgi:post-segregation antitoxin (ccd killing protein)